MSSRARAEAPHLRLVQPEPTPAPRPRSPALDDAQLVAALIAGDSSAAGAFYERARPVVDRSIFRILGRRDRDHDDLAQMSMIELIGSIERFRGDCPLDGWIATVTAHTVFKHLRRRKTESKIFGPDDAMDRSSYDIAPEKRSVLRGVVGRIRDHLSSLEPNKAWTFLLHHVCGYDLKEIAEITDVSVAAAQGRLSRGRRELLSKLREDPELMDLIEQQPEVQP